MINAIGSQTRESFSREIPKSPERPPPHATNSAAHVAADAVRLSKEAQAAAESRNNRHNTSRS
jgi:hypothetical protein